MDNTFMTPYLQRPLSLGADIAIHSGTKYLGGHSGVISGFVVVKDPALADRLYFLQNSTGGVLGPFDSFLMLRGIKTLGVRMDRHTANAQVIARWLEVQAGLLPGAGARPRLYHPAKAGIRSRRHDLL